MKYLLIIFLVLSISGCAVPTYKPNLTASGEIPQEKGLVVLTHGRKNRGIGGVFVSYDVVRINKQKQVLKSAFLQAEKVRLYKPSGDLDSGYYGFMHIFELHEGTYYLIGRSGRGYNSMVAAGGLFISLGNSNKITPIMMKIEVVGGKINYLGEIIALDKPLTNDNITIADRRDRDIETARERIPGFDNFELVYFEPEKVNYKSIIPEKY